MTQPPTGAMQQQPQPQQQQQQQPQQLSQPPPQQQQQQPPQPQQMQQPQPQPGQAFPVQPPPHMQQQQQPNQGMAMMPVQMGHGQNMQQAQMAGGMMMQQPGPGGGGMQMGGGGGGMPMGGGRADPLEEMLGPFPCVRLRGMPFEATVDDVLRFFQGLTIVDVIMTLRPDGRGAGEALVLFSNPMDLNMAVSRDKQHMGRRYIEIFSAKRPDYYHAVMAHVQHMEPHSRMGGGHGHHSFRNGPHMMHLQQQHHHGGGGGGGGAHHGGGQHSGPAAAAGQPAAASPALQAHGPGTQGGQVAGVEHTGVIRMRGLPFSATKADVVNFFSGLTVLDESVQFVVRGDGRVTGEAFVTLSSPAEAEAAMQRNGSNMGSRYIELFPSAIEEAARHTSRHH